jgi:hypothetical protein
MKLCTCCNQNKNFSDFYKDKSRKDGYRPSCKSCGLTYRESNRSKIAEKQREYSDLNKEKERLRVKKYYESNKIRILIDHRKYRDSNKSAKMRSNRLYRILNVSRIHSLSAKRRAMKINATPAWLTKEDHVQIQELYEIAQAFKLYTGQQYHVDHIVPLQGKNVCGLHVPWNLQVLEASENIRKSNKLL